MAAEVEIFDCLSDNFGYLLHDSETGKTAAIDAPEDGPILQALARRGWTLTHLLITHHHHDHTDGIAPLKAAFDPVVIGPEGEKNRIAGLDKTVKGGDRIDVGSLTLDVIETPGHTLGHIVYHDASNHLLFSADALFSLGCGRMFEGTPGPMWAGLSRLRDLGDETLVYCGHEYSKANAAFALSIDGTNAALKARADEIAAQRTAGKPTIPVRLGDEKRANPFLRADEPGLAAAMGLPVNSAPAEVFAAIRRAKDNF